MREKIYVITSRTFSKAQISLRESSVGGCFGRDGGGRSSLRCVLRLLGRIEFLPFDIMAPSWYTARRNMPIMVVSVIWLGSMCRARH
jgi:hypothetical protein